MAEEIKEQLEQNDSKNTVNTEAKSDESESKSSGSKKIESLESALRRFKRQSAGVISEVRKREAYDKPSVKRKKKSKEARKHKKSGKINFSKW